MKYQSPNELQRVQVKGYSNLIYQMSKGGNNKNILIHGVSHKKSKRVFTNNIID